MSALLLSRLAVSIAATHQVVTSVYVLKVINLTVTAKDVSILMSALQKLTTVNICVSTLWVHSSATVHVDL